MKYDDFLVFLDVWVFSPRFWAGEGVANVKTAQNKINVTCSCMLNCFYFAL